MGEKLGNFSQEGLNMAKENKTNGDEMRRGETKRSEVSVDDRKTEKESQNKFGIVWRKKHKKYVCRLLHENGKPFFL